MLRDFPAYGGLCENSNINFCFVDENGWQATKQCIIILSRSYNGRKTNRVHLCLIVVNIVIKHLIFDFSQRQCRQWFQNMSKFIPGADAILFVIEFRPYITLFTSGMYKHADMFSLVRMVCITPHLWKKLSNVFW